MSLKYRDKNGAERVISGLTPGGDLAMGANTTRSGTISCEASSTQSYCQKNIAFTEPMPDGDYIIEIQPASGDWEVEQWTCVNKTASGFTFVVHNINHTAPFVATNFHYNAFKLYEVSQADQNASDITDIKAKIPSTASSSNKLATSNELSSLGTTIDGRLDALEDTIPSSASLQNQLITETELTTALQGKQDTLTFDDTPTEDSSNPVTSDGIKDAIDGTATDIYKVMGKNGAKNLLPFDLNELKRLNTSGTWNGASYTNNGVTFAINSDNTISTSGTSSARFGFTIYLNYDARNMIMSGCPQGGARATYSLQYSNYSDQSFADIGNGYTIPSAINTGTWRVVIWIESGAVLDNLTFKPMLRLASDTDSTYQPYAMTNQQMTPYVQSVSNPNLLDNPWFTVNQRGAESYTAYGYTLDRWKNNSASDAITLTPTEQGLDLLQNITSGSGYINQVFESPLPSGKYTISVNVVSITGRFIIQCRYSDGTYSAYPNVTTTGITSLTIDSGTRQITGILLQTYVGTDAVIRAIKVERGPASTLANDIAPNYQQELAKCQRYFQRIIQAGSSDTLCMATYRNDYTLRTVLPLTVPMRAAPSVTVNGTVSDYTNSGLTMAKISQPVTNGGAVGISFNISKSGVTWNNGVSKCITPDSTDFYIDFSADL